MLHGALFVSIYELVKTNILHTIFFLRCQHISAECLAGLKFTEVMNNQFGQGVHDINFCLDIVVQAPSWIENTLFFINYRGILIIIDLL